MLMIINMGCIGTGINFIKLSRLENSVFWANVWRFTGPSR